MITNGDEKEACFFILLPPLFLLSIFKHNVCLPDWLNSSTKCCKLGSETDVCDLYKLEECEDNESYWGDFWVQEGDTLCWRECASVCLRYTAHSHAYDILLIYHWIFYDKEHEEDLVDERAKDASHVIHISLIVSPANQGRFDTCYSA